VNKDVLNQAPIPAPSLQPITVIILCMLILCLLGISSIFADKDVYTESVLELMGNPVKGRSIFVMNCVDCHGQWADGKVGPSLRHVSERLSKVRLIHQVVSGDTPPMPQFQPTPQEMADLLSYLNQL